MTMKMTASALVALLGLTACTSSDHDMAATTTGAGSGTIRTHYVQAELAQWDYAPQGRNFVTGEAFDDTAKVFVGKGPDRVGSTYTKCLYREYTDATFRTRAERDADDAYEGFLGPTLRAEVGDTLKVTFKNTCPFAASMHPHGVRYAKDSEGADGTPVETGGTTTYTWEVPERSGPGPMEGSSVGWMYHSHADEIGDVYAGLTGFLVVTAKGKARPDGSPKDVDREVFSLYEVVDENASPLLERNTKGLRVDVEDEDFVESNLMHAVNGYVYANGPQVQLRKGKRARWYLMGMGTEVDLHTPHWHGNTAVANGMRTDVVSLLPATMVTADMTPDAVGSWLFHCHVGDHIAAGMQARYEVVS